MPGFIAFVVLAVVLKTGPAIAGPSSSTSGLATPPAWYSGDPSRASPRSRSFDFPKHCSCCTYRIAACRCRCSAGMGRAPRRTERQLVPGWAAVGSAGSRPDCRDGRTRVRGRDDPASAHSSAAAVAVFLVGRRHRSHRIRRAIARRRLAPSKTGRGFGAYHGLMGLAALPSGLLFGMLYQSAGGPRALRRLRGRQRRRRAAWLLVSRRMTEATA